ncbi:ATP-binding protein [uncultured Cellulomonas sp.]|uniref:ATP-binding protein n=1 Tax=uncultured Cellulomonas sp. TaxID=189682 RepID=UPI002639F780|nr:ATP-binding protein [uncultured Cellulomonas sp.]
MPLTLEPLASSVRVGRHWVLDQASTARVPQTALPVIELLAGEILTNAILHGSLGQPVTIKACLSDDLFGVAVLDRSPDHPLLLQPDTTAPGGRGIMLIDMLATEWGCHVLDSHGKSVWFQLAVNVQMRLGQP